MWVLPIAAFVLWGICVWCVFMRCRGSCIESTVGAYFSAAAAIIISLVYGFSSPEQVKVRAETRNLMYQHCWGTPNQTRNCVAMQSKIEQN